MSLAVPVTTFVGRDVDIVTLLALVRERRLVTLTGAGGSGKTRLALELGRLLEGDFEAVVWVQLGSLADPSLVSTTVAAALGIPEPPEPVTDTVIRNLSARNVLLVLDSCEHLIDSCARLAARVVQEVPTASVLATSRELLGIAGEVRWPVPPLSLPNADDDGDAVRLFIDRAKVSQPGFELDEDSRTAVAEICRRLDGIPLAIELAAARTRMLSVHEIVTGLADRFRLLTGGERAALPRQRTMEASVDWSYALLTEEERRVLRLLSVFNGSFTIVAAEHVCAVMAHNPRDVFDAVTSLVDRSLLQVVGDGRHRRFRMLETIRDYAHQKLADAGEASEARDRFVEWCAAFTREAAEGLEGAEPLDWLRCVDAELDNIRGTLDISAHISDADAGMRIVGQLLLYWFTRGEMAIGRSRVAATLERGGSGEDRVAALTSLCVIAYRSGTLAHASTFGEDAVSIAREIGDQRGLARALHHRGWVRFWGESDPRRAWVDFAEADRLLVEVGDSVFIALNRAILGFTCIDTSRTREAGALLDEALALMPPGGAPRANALVARGWLRHLQGRAEDATVDLTAALRVAAEAGDRYVELVSRSLLAVLDAEAGRSDEAHQQVTLGLEKAREHRLPFPEACTLFASGMRHLTLGNLPEAASDLAAAHACTPLIWFRGVVRSFQARVALQSGHPDDARAHSAEALELGNLADAARPRVLALSTLAELSIADGEHLHGEQLLRDSLDLAVEAGLDPLIVIALEGLSGTNSARGKDSVAALLRRTIDAVGIDSRRLALLAGVGPTGTHDNNGADEQQTEPPPLEDAVAAIRGRAGVQSRPTHGWDSLTDAERKVVQLVTEGLTNPQIGQRLFVSPRTVQTHVAHVFAKLHVSTRSELAAFAAHRAAQR